MKADSWILNELPEYLIKDWYELYIYNESDMQASAYYWLRDYFDRERSAKWIVRTQPFIPLSLVGGGPRQLVESMSQC
jgi:hypothetical protein